MELNEIVKISKEVTGTEPYSIEKLPEGGSPRHYTRVILDEAGNKSVIVTEGNDHVENRSFCMLARAFGDYARDHKEQFAGISFPEILYHTSDYSVYMQSDLGDVSLFDLIRETRKVGVNPEDSLRSLIQSVLDALIKVQTIPESVWEDKVFNRRFGERMVHWDLNYFKYEFLKPAGVTFNEDLLQDDFESLAEVLTEVDDEYTGFMYRDFQSRNIMIAGSGIGLIDFQGGRKGVCIYDAISFLWQARAGFSHKFRMEMLDYYINRYCGQTGGNIGFLRGVAHNYVLFRTLQVLGAYGFRGLVEGKAHFIESIPGAIRNLSELLANGDVDNYPELKKCCEILCADTRWQKEKTDGLTIEVCSFSYKKGYPKNFTGNGGGFMFDCRGMHNPGRYEEYKKLTGLDKPVIHFLEERGEVDLFVKNAKDIVSPSIKSYLRRGFNDLQVGFGCTGGQHRSVYCAERFAREIAEEYPEATVKVYHREQNVPERKLSKQVIS